MADHIDLRPMDPFYRIRFHDGESFEYNGDVAAMREQVARFNPDDVEGYMRFMRMSEEIYRIGFERLGDQPFSTVMDMARIAGDIIKLKGYRSVYGLVSTFMRDERLRTIVKLRVIGRAQQLLRIDFENEPDHEVLQQMLDDFMRELPLHDAVLFSDYGKGGLTHITQMIEAARQAGKPVLVDPKGSDYARYAGATVITPNRSELMQVVGAWGSEEQLADKAQALRASLGIETLLLTRSEDGMTIFDVLGSAHEAAQTREVFDVTGAGDTVIATMAVLLAAGVDARDAMTHANRAGGIVVGKFGTASASYAELFG
jgi:rfaE bifunctional protein kinase chain/domain